MAVIRRKESNPAAAAVRKPRPVTLHDELVDRACRWLKGTCGCSVSVGELRAFTGSGETPDAIGWRAEYSILVECKTSRADFFADLKKPFRVDPAMGVGTYRFYLCPPGLIQPDDLPDGWGLLYQEERRIRLVCGPKGNIWSHGDNARFMHSRNQDAEIAMLVSVLRRSQ
ncbi:hypothetical protein [Marinobacter shengliensis]|uniref:hypothetical protein n=1 Tax=Marinobacter shengliensis TaxID=1389223 RepID=UPI001BB14EF0|nr:hypothetical protein [Marinobacter shengliensis]